MICKYCKSENTKIIYDGQIRNGGLGQYTEENVPIYQCEDCHIIWHEPVISDSRRYYESQEYRKSLEGTSEEQDFYRLHDKESFEKFRYTGTEIFRNKVVTDIGCGCGAFLDFIKGVASRIVAIEPSQTYRTIMERKGFETFPYAQEALKKYKESVDVVVSFDVIEHVENPAQFIEETFALLKKGGRAIIGTPTDAPVMRDFLGEIYEKKLLYSTQHLWILSKKNLEMMAKDAGFESFYVEYFQRYGLDNLLGWLREKAPCSEIQSDVLSRSLDGVWKGQCEDAGLADYIVLYLEK